jgi:hypothetical protein
MKRNAKRLFLSAIVLLPLLFLTSCGGDNTKPAKPEKNDKNKMIEENS